MNPRLGLFSLIATSLGFGLLAAWAATPPDPQGGAASGEPPPERAGGSPEPHVELDADLIYAILLGEVAEQRHDPWMAFAHYLEAARLASDARLAELATRAALRAGEPSAAQRAVGLWLELAPDSVAGQLVAAQVALLLDKEGRARLHLQRVVALLRPAGRDSFLELAALVAKVEPVAQRIGLMRALVAEDAENVAAQYALALVAADAKDYEEATAAARQAIAAAPDWDQPRMLLVRLLIAQGKRREAREALEGFVDETPDGHVLRMLYAQLLVEDQEFSDARNVFERMLQTTPTEPDVLFAIAILSLQLDDASAARGYFERLYATGERRDDAALYLGQIEEDAGEFDKALKWYDKVDGEATLDARMRSAGVHAKRGETAKARDILAQLREQWPEHAVTLYLIEGELVQQHERPEAAIEVFDEALAEHPEDADLLYARGLLAASLGAIEITERDMRAILADDPAHADALNALGYTLADQTERYEEAHALIQRALTLKPEEPAVLDSMGWVLFKMGRVEEALGYLRQAYERLPDGEIAAHLGEALWAAGQRTQAWQVWDEALDAHPDHGYLRQVIDRYRHLRPSTER